MHLKQMKSFITLLALLVACQPNHIKKDKVLVVHLRGVSFESLQNYLSQSESNFLTESNYLKPLEPIVNAVTISNIASYETGTLPSEHGIIGHQYAIRDTSLVIVNGFSQRFEVPSFWEIADSAGKRALNVGALTMHGKYEQHEHVDTWAQGEFLTPEKFIRLIPDQANTNQFEVANGQTAFTYYTDTSGDSLIIDTDNLAENGWLDKVSQGAWAEWVQSEEGRPVIHRVKWLASTGDTLELYQRATFASRGYPKSFIQQMNNSIGPTRGWPNIPAYTSGQLDLETLLEETEMEIDDVIQAFNVAASNKDYDLILLDYPLMDRYGHLLFPPDDQQVITSQPLNTAYARMVKDLKTLHSFAAKEGFSLILTSGHGFSYIHSAININRWLIDMGISADITNPNWQAIGVPGKVSGHIYLNPALSPDTRAEILLLLHPDSLSDRFVDDVFFDKELASIGLDHQNAGDIFVLLKPGYVFSNNLIASDSLIGTPVFRGDHGYSPSYETSKGFIYTDQNCDPCHVTDVSRIVLKKLGLE